MANWEWEIYPMSSKGEDRDVRFKLVIFKGLDNFIIIPNPSQHTLEFEFEFVLINEIWSQ